MTSTIKTVTISASAIPARFGRYQMRVLRRGHIPGVLSGAELAGLARQYGDRYARSRESVRAFLADFGVTDAIVTTRHGCPRVWVDAQTGEPVRVVVVE